jgi:localization factor PodJL
VPRDEAEAYKWFSIAANGGDRPARASAIELGAKLTSVQLAAAERAANTFRPMTPAAAVAAPATSIASAQKVLGRLGYYNGPSNGAASPELKLAVSAYQRDQGLAVTGLIDPATASRLAVFTR